MHIVALRVFPWYGRPVLVGESIELQDKYARFLVLKGYARAATPTAEQEGGNDGEVKKPRGRPRKSGG